MFTKDEFWKNYMVRWFGEDLIGKWEKHARIEQVVSNNGTINLEVYSGNDRDAPVIVFAHGIAGYGRVLLPFLIPLFEKGYNIVSPDLQGYGYNGGLKGDFEWNAHVRNLADTVRFARDSFDGRIILGGASMGGPLAYSASCLVPDLVDALACWCLWDFSDREFMTRETSTGRFTYALVPFLKIAATLFGRARLKTYRLISYDTLTGSMEFNDLLKRDPQAGTRITVKGAVSLILQSRPLVAHRDFTKPVLVLQPGNDRMTPKYYTKKTFDELGSENKRYVELEGCEHFPVEGVYYRTWTEEVDRFIRGL